VPNALRANRAYASLRVIWHSACEYLIQRCCTRICAPPTVVARQPCCGIEDQCVCTQKIFRGTAFDSPPSVRGVHDRRAALEKSSTATCSHTLTHRHRHRHTHTHTHTHRERERERDTYTYIHRHTQRHTHRHRHRHTQTHAHTHTIRNTRTKEAESWDRLLYMSWVPCAHQTKNRAPYLRATSPTTACRARVGRAWRLRCIALQSVHVCE
jgi:hypothetical protein